MLAERLSGGLDIEYVGGEVASLCGLVLGLVVRLVASFLGVR